MMILRLDYPPEITIEEIEAEYISEVEAQQEKSLKKERIVAKCPECSSSIFIKLGPNGSFYIQHGIKAVSYTHLTLPTNLCV